MIEMHFFTSKLEFKSDLIWQLDAYDLVLTRTGSGQSAQERLSMRAKPESMNSAKDLHVSEDAQDDGLEKASLDHRRAFIQHVADFAVDMSHAVGGPMKNQRVEAGDLGYSGSGFAPSVVSDTAAAA